MEFLSLFECLLNDVDVTKELVKGNPPIGRIRPIFGIHYAPIANVSVIYTDTGLHFDLRVRINVRNFEVVDNKAICYYLKGGELRHIKSSSKKCTFIKKSQGEARRVGKADVFFVNTYAHSIEVWRRCHNPSHRFECQCDPHFTGPNEGHNEGICKTRAVAALVADQLWKREKIRGMPVPEELLPK